MGGIGGILVALIFSLIFGNKADLKELYWGMMWNIFVWYIVMFIFGIAIRWLLMINFLGMTEYLGRADRESKRMKLVRFISRVMAFLGAGPIIIEDPWSYALGTSFYLAAFWTLQKSLKVKEGVGNLNLFLLAVGFVLVVLGAQLQWKASRKKERKEIALE